MGHLTKFSTATSLLGVLCGCGADIGTDSYDHSDSNRLRMVEVLSSVTEEPHAFIELRNDSQVNIDGTRYTLRVGQASPRPLQTRIIDMPADETDAQPIAAGQLALVVDQAMPDEQLRRIACERPIATDIAAIASKNPVLASSLQLTSEVRCLPVFTLGGDYQSLGPALSQANELTLLLGDQVRDGIQGFWSSAPVNHAIERTGSEAHEVRQSPIGSSPGERNYFSVDAHRAIEVLSSSPWRIGQRVMELQLLTVSGSNDATAAKSELAALLDGELPANPMAHHFNDTLAKAKKRAHGALYQVNDTTAVDGLREAASRGIDIHLVTDGEFMDEDSYQDSHDTLRDSGVALQYDLDQHGKNRSATMHDKFVVIDGKTTFTGSYNPVVDKPFRIHADNALVLENREVAALHEQELGIMRAGHFGVDKRDHGVAGGDSFVDGAPVTVRFSPGLTYKQRKRRADALNAGSNLTSACDVTVPSTGNFALQERYRKLSPCGGPMDTILSEIARAKSSIYFVSFSLSLDDMVELFIERHHAGVDLKGVVDPTVSSRPQVGALIEAGGDVRYTPNSDPACPSYITPQSACPKNPNKVWLHHKFVVIDYGTEHPVVITGSHNLSEVAEKQNDDALVVIRDRAVAESYYRIFREAYDHPQTLGTHRDMSKLPALAITRVVPSLDPAVPSEVEVTNFDSQTVSTKSLDLWNREQSIDLPSVELAAGESRTIIISSAGAAATNVSDIVLSLDEGRFLSPQHALVLRHADGRWVSSYDPYLAQHNLPNGVDIPHAGAAHAWQYDPAKLAALRLALLGNNTTPDAPVPTWAPAGLYSDWPDEHDVTSTGLLLMQSAAAQWHPTPTP